MTPLQRAHEELRKEAISLRRENAKLKAGTYVDKDRAEHEKEIRRLNREISDLSKAKERYRSYWHDTESLKERLCDKYSTELASVKKELSDLKTDYALLETKYQEAMDTIKQLKVQMNRDHENSSIPSSKERFPKKVKNSREKTDRKPGAQSGHTGHKRPFMEPTRPVIRIPVPDEISENPDYYLTGKEIRKQVIDFELSVSVTEYITSEYRCRSTGTRGHASFPDGISNEFNYGSNVKALAFLLNNYCNVSIDKTRELIEGLSDGKILLSKGLINKLSHQFSANTATDREIIFKRLLQAPVMYSDATPGRVNGKTMQVILCANEDEMLYFFREHKGHEGIKGTPVETYQQCLIHDHDKTYYHYGSDHQECLAHVLRYLEDSIQNEKDLTWNSLMKEHISSMIHAYKKAGHHLEEQQILSFEKEYGRIISIGQQEYLLHPPNKYYPDGYNLLKRMDEYKKEHLYFLRHPEADYTNNLSERGLRKFKRKLKQAVTFRSKQSMEDLCNCMSVIETNRLYDINIFQLSKDVFSLVPV